jgi:hypothetical protein
MLACSRGAAPVIPCASALAEGRTAYDGPASYEIAGSGSLCLTNRPLLRPLQHELRRVPHEAGPAPQCAVSAWFPFRGEP